MNQGQFNELMNELRGIATKLDRLLDGQTKQQAERVNWSSTPGPGQPDAVDKVLTPDKPKTTKKAKG